MDTDRILLRQATALDAEAIGACIEPYAAAGLILARPLDELRELAGNFVVAEDGSGIVGCVALRDYGDGLQEVRTLVVRDDRQGKGLGSHLVGEAVDRARARQARRVFTLTRRPRLFLLQGFRIVPKDLFPQKVWSDCAACPIRDCCDEVAMLLEF
jgi:amino-acid N-acetyltransferase